MHRIYLVPGFFGFVNLGDVRYYKHVHALLQHRLGQADEPGVVHEVATHPTASLRERTRRLYQAMAATAGPDDILHIVGHSSGGLDARLFVAPGVSLDDEVEPFASRVRSVVTVATPHHGTPAAAAFTTLAGKRLLRLLSMFTVVVLRRGSVPLGVVLDLARLVKALDSQLDTAPGVVDELFVGLLSELTEARRAEVAAFFEEVGDDQGLLPQITPDALDVFNATAQARPGVRYGSVVTRARPPGMHGVVGAGLSPNAQASNAVYLACHHLAAPSSFLGEVEALADRWPELAPEDNDSMVPTSSQLYGELIAAVDADHLDVIGHFSGPEQAPPHYDWVRTGTHFRRPDFERTWDQVLAFLMAAR
ncbi:MAG: triacylglycerol lipase [Deltaproteobacteria bacterium]|nr:MAG: triacylglycerol lipase [Deltaproteobacteria bacterium]